MKQHATLQKIIKSVALCFILFAFNLNTSNAQKTTLRSRSYDSYLRSGSIVRVQTVEGQKIQTTDTSRVSNLQLDATKKNVVSYESKVAVLDTATLKRFREETKTITPNDEIKVLPEIHVEPTNGNETVEATTYRIVFTSEQPLRYDEKQQKFTANLAFLLINQTGPNVAPVEPVKVEIKSDEISTIEPGFLQLTHLSIPSSIVSLNAELVSDSARVKVITVSNPQGYITYLKVKPSLEISSNRHSIQGLGIQEVPITVKFHGSSSTDTVQVTFSCEKGTVSPNPLVMRYNETATVYVRSEGMGKSKITANASLTGPKNLDLKFTFPLYFLLATIAGGLTGTYIKQHPKSGKKKTSTKIFLVGILTGLVGAAAYYVLGINLLGLSFSAGLNEMAVFAVSALFAYFGISLVKPGSDE